jgi:hypothetical protein
MSHSSNLPLLSHPAFSQVFGAALNQLVPGNRRFPDAPIYCENELPQYGGELCARVATVCDLETERMLCMGCFRG